MLTPEQNFTSNINVEVELNIQNETNKVRTALLNLPDCGQDRVMQWHNDGSDGTEPFDLIAVFDGHGTIPVGDLPYSKHFVNCLDELSQDTKCRIFTSNNPMEALIKYFSTTGKFLYHVRTGAVASIARIYNDRIETFNVGDATTMVFIDDKLAFINKHHNAENPEEAIRLKATFEPHGYSIKLSEKLQVISPTNIKQVPSTYTTFYHTDAHGKRVETVLAPTQSLGHNDATGYDIAVDFIPYSRTQRVKVIVMTDGVMEMVYLPKDWDPFQELPDDLRFLTQADAPEIANWARSRWSQEWTTHVPGYAIGKQRFEENKYGQDDIGVATFSHFPEASLISDTLNIM